MDDNKPYLYKTDDYGKSWTEITHGIPDGEFTRVIREDPAQRGLLYAGTETGIYVSFDDGGQWQRMGGDLPVCPIYDLVIKEDDLVVATHGRSFWILDDLAPLRQLAADLQDGGTRLFANAPKVRMRVYQGFGGWDGEARGDMAQYGMVGTSIVGFIRDGKSDRPQFLNAGANPRAGVLIRYHLDEAVDDIQLNIRDAAGGLIRSYSSEDGLSADAGMNRFHWNLRYGGAEDVDEELASWERPDGPLVAPGDYVAELVAAGESHTQTLTALADPRLETTAEEFAAQRDLLLRIRDRLTQNNRLINRVLRLKRQVAGWTSRCDDAAVTEAADAINAQVDALLPLLINTGISEAQLYPSGIHEKLNALFESVDSADYAPPRQAYEVMAKLSAELEGHVAAADGELGEAVAAFNAAIAALGLPAVDA